MRRSVFHHAPKPGLNPELHPPHRHNGAADPPGSGSAAATVVILRGERCARIPPPGRARVRGPFLRCAGGGAGARPRGSRGQSSLAGSYCHLAAEPPPRLPWRATCAPPARSTAPLLAPAAGALLRAAPTAYRGARCQRHLVHRRVTEVLLPSPSG